MPGVGDAAFHGPALAAVTAATWTTRLASNAVLYDRTPPRTGKRGRPRKRGARLGTCAQIAADAATCWQRVEVRAHGTVATVHVAVCDALWYGSFGDVPGRCVLVRDPDSSRAYDLGLFTLDRAASVIEIVERYACRWAIEPANATGKQLIGAGDAANRTAKAVERTVPFAFLAHSLMIIWYALVGNPDATVAGRQALAPWYRTKRTPAPADIHAALRLDLLADRIIDVSAGHSPRPQTARDTVTSPITAA